MTEITSIKKDTNWQIARGLAIVCVILIHCPNAINSIHESIDFNSWLVLRQFINFPVALFFYISGRFTHVYKYPNVKSFLINRGGRRLLLPFLFWSTIFGIIIYITSLFNGSSISAKNLTLSILLGRTAPHLYYIIALLQLILLTPILLKCINKRTKNVIYLITPTWLIILYCWCYTQKSMPPLYQTLFPAWIGFYIWGIINQKKEISFAINRVWFVLPAIIFEIIETYISLWIVVPDSFVCSQIRVSSFVFASVIIMFFEQKHVWKIDRPITHLLIYLGDRSYGIYYTHYLFIILCRRWVSGISVHIFGITWLPRAIITFFIALFGSLGAIWVGRKILLKCKIPTSIMGF